MLGQAGATSPVRGAGRRGFWRRHAQCRHEATRLGWTRPCPAAEGPWPLWSRRHHGSARSPAPLPQPRKGLSASLRLWLGYSCRVKPGSGSPRWCRDAHAGSAGCQLSSHAAGAGPAPGAEPRCGASQAAGAAGQSLLALVGDRAPGGLESAGRWWPALHQPQQGRGARGGRERGPPKATGWAGSGGGCAGARDRPRPAPAPRGSRVSRGWGDRGRHPGSAAAARDAPAESAVLAFPAHGTASPGRSAGIIPSGSLGVSGGWPPAPAGPGRASLHTRLCCGDPRLLLAPRSALSAGAGAWGHRTAPGVASPRPCAAWCGTSPVGTRTGPSQPQQQCPDPAGAPGAGCARSEIRSWRR